MNSNYLTWNLPNWITVFLMAMVGYALVSTGFSFVKSRLAR